MLLATEQTFPPPPEFAAQANASDPGIYERADADPEAWWGSWAEKLDWIEPFDEILDWSEPPFAKWFTGGKLNVSANCLDRHVAAGDGERVAYYWEGEDGTRKEITYAWLLEQTQRFANGLKSLGVGKGDVVGIFMPMVPEAAVAMLACTRIGAIHNVVFGGFSAASVAERMEVSGAKALITADATLRRGKPTPMKAAIDGAIADLDSLEHVIVVDRADTGPPMSEGRDHLWDELIEAADAGVPAGADGRRGPAVHPLHVGLDREAEGDPAHDRRLSDRRQRDAQARLRPQGRRRLLVRRRHRLGHRPQLHRLRTARQRRDLGDVRGRSQLPGRGPLVGDRRALRGDDHVHGPDRDPRLHEVGRRARRKARPELAAPARLGRRADQSRAPGSGTTRHIGGGRCPIVDTWWQTETGAIMITPLPGLTTTKPGSATVPFPGIEAKIFDEEGEEVTEGGGILVLTRPWPAMARTLFNEPERFVETYWERFGRDTYLVGDAARSDEDGYFWVVGRTDDVINVSGHRLSTMEVESALVSHEKVAEAAVIGVPDEDTGQAIFAFVTPQGDTTGDDALEAELRDHVADKIGKLARPKRMAFADDLPKTRSGKIMRRLLRDIAAGKELGDVSTLRDPEVVEDLKKQLAG